MIGRLVKAVHLRNENELIGILLKGIAVDVVGQLRPVLSQLAPNGGDRSVDGDQHIGGFFHHPENGGARENRQLNDVLAVLRAEDNDSFGFSAEQMIQFIDSLLCMGVDAIGDSHILVGKLNLHHDDSFPQSIGGCTHGKRFPIL